MKVALLSDLHIEFRDYNKSIELIPTEGYDVLLLLGDIYHTPRFLHDVCEKITDKQIIYVMGNHELYGQKYMGFGMTESNYTDLQGLYDNLLVIDSKVNHIDIDDYRFFGCTNWPSIPNDLEMIIHNSVNDFHTGNVTILDCNESKIQSDKDLKVIVDTNKQLIGLTHFIPHYECVHPKWKNPRFDTLNVYFCSPIDYSIYSKCSHWFFGHGHDPINITMDGCNFVSNPLGYPGEWRNESSWKPLIINI